VTVADHFMRLLGPVLERVPVDLAYFFEDCCGRNGPLFSPTTYRAFYDQHYRRMVEFYHGHGVRWVLLDSDGKTDPLIPCWLESGIDILFPIEVGVWQAAVGLGVQADAVAVGYLQRIGIVGLVAHWSSL
ncbi:MAG: hypothetical protein HN380_33055, partial [Victivallales bacterium]|nr:hypothetical protein [Victivallales bacterium]